VLCAEVAVEAARMIDHETYTYLVPEGMDLVPGQRVWVPFGRRHGAGYVTELHTDGGGEMELKAIEHADTSPLLLPHQMGLAREVSAHYWAPLIECLRAMLPPRVRRPGSGGAGPSTRQTRHSQLLQYVNPSGPPEPAPLLTPDQREALKVIADRRRVLLHGVAASGKTEVYMAAAERVLAKGLRVLVLVPEISLTPQLVERFSRRLGVPLAVLHSALTELERAQQWWRVRRGEVDLVIGSRSAVFAPVPRLGLICVDEEGSSAYKQDRIPRYETGWVARRLAESTGARLVLGSATPSVESYRETETGALALAELPHRIRGEAAEIELVDLREELRRGNRQPLSETLIEAVDGALRREEQAILFLNRRGASTFILCRDCGKSILCPGCSVSLVQHPELGGLACHYCGYLQAQPPTCPHCGSAQLRALGIGTQRLEGLVQRLWPEARVLRLDRDALRSPEAYWNIFETFSQHRADILVGTQLVARGLDLEDVSTVGVVDADLPLHFPDYRAAESAYALVAQVAGRAGRNRRPARVVVQTSNPDHYSLRAAQRGDYRSFYEQEFLSRTVFEFPPAVQLAVLTYANDDDGRASATAGDAAERLASAIVAERLEGIRVQGPSPAFMHRLRGEFRWQVTVKGRDLERLRPHLPRGRGWSFDVDPQG
jgi:primosomal protein N' (replication factor Y)